MKILYFKCKGPDCGYEFIQDLKRDPQGHMVRMNKQGHEETFGWRGHYCVVEELDTSSLPSHLVSLRESKEKMEQYDNRKGRSDIWYFLIPIAIYSTYSILQA